MTSERQLGTPDIPAGSATFTTYASTRIAAPAALVFRTLRNSDTWRDWNRFVPRVTITEQPENEDHATVAEIAELVRNTSIAGSVDSAITDGAAPGTNGSLIGRRMSLEEEDDVRLAPPPVTRERFRSIASTSSGKPGSQGGRLSGVGDRPNSAVGQPRNSIAGNAETDGAPRLSGAQQYAAAQAARKQSIASGQVPTTNSNVLVEAPHDPNILIKAPPTQTAQDASKQQRRSSVSVAEKRMKSINALYGEPSIRIQLGTKMTFHCRMHMPASFAIDRTIQVVVTELSRPDDPYESPFSAAALAGDPASVEQLKRTATHTLSKTGVYRIVWTLSTPYSGIKAPPKFLLQAQRVHEIRPVVRGDGKEECVYEDWECQRGVLAKTVKSKFGPYLEKRFQDWGQGLKGYCEAMGGAVERRDFVG